MFHLHKYGNVDDRGLQYCTICNKARIIKFECQHIWKENDSYRLKNFNTGLYIGKIYIMQCTKCGEILDKRVDL